jgi:hypothetical protein
VPHSLQNLLAAAVGIGATKFCSLIKNFAAPNARGDQRDAGCQKYY